MTTFIRQGLFWTFAVMLVLPSVAQAQFHYVTNANNTITITGYTGTGGVVNIPSTTNGFPVVNIGNNAFSGCYKITHITVPSSITSIGQYAFQNCSDLTDMTIPNSVTNIGMSLFVNCTNLTSVTIGNGITSIWSYTFQNCSNLTAVCFYGNAPSLGSSVFAGDSNATVYYLQGTAGWFATYGGRPTAMFFPCTYTTNSDNTITITGYAGPGGAVIIPSTINGLPLISIGTNAFYNCTSLTSVTIPSSVTNIGDSAFASSASLTNIYFQGNAPTLGVSVFAGDNATVYYLFGATGWANPWGGLPTALLMSTVTVNPSQGGTVTGGGTYAVGTNIQLTATAANGWLFTSWSDGSKNNPYAMTVSATNVTYMANFTVQYTWTTNNGTITITGYRGAGGTVSIPSTINGFPVTSFGNNAFQNCTNLTSMTIPDSVTNIGSYTFMNCANLTSVTLGSGITSLAPYTFSGCGLTYMTIPDGVTNIGSYTFMNCSNLTSVTLGTGITSLQSFTFCGCARLASLTIPNSVTNIGSSAFANCNNLASVTLGSGITSLQSYAFGGCPALASVTIPPSVTSIWDFAFANCSGLKSITIPASVTSIGMNAFQNCIGMTAMVVSASNPVYSSRDGVLFNKMQTTLLQCPDGIAGDYTIPAGVTSLGSGAFQYCARLTSVTIPSNVTSIASMAISYCYGLTAIVVSASNPFYSSSNGVLFNKMQTTLIQYPAGKTGSYTIPDKVTSIMGGAFSSCSGLTGITIGTNSASIYNNNSFMGCSRLTSITVNPLNPTYSSTNGVLFNKSQTILIMCPTGKTGSYTIPSGVTNIGPSAFGYCASLAGVTIPDSVTTIASYPFMGCTNLTSVTLGSGIRSLVEYVFQGCCNLMNVTISSGVTNIGQYAFSGLPHLASVTIPGSVISIGSNAFACCCGLMVVFFDGNAPRVDPSAFSGDFQATGYYLQGTSGWGATIGGLSLVMYAINSGAVTIVQYTGSGTKVVIPSTLDGLPVTSIGSDAFLACLNLNTITICPSVTSIGNSAFYGCSNLMSAFFLGSAPSLGSSVFSNDNRATIFYMSGTTGWGKTFGGRSTVLWNPQFVPDTTFGMQHNQFGFTLSGDASLTVVVESSPDMIHWTPVATNSLAGGSVYFSDPATTNAAGQFYRLVQP